MLLPVFFFVQTVLIAETPVHDGIEDRQEITAHRGQGILHMRRNLIELLPADQAVLLQFAQCFGQHGVGDAGQSPLQLAEADRVMDAHFIHDLGLPSALQHEEQGCDGTVAVACDDALPDIDKVILIGHVGFLLILHPDSLRISSMKARG